MIIRAKKYKNLIDDYAKSEKDNKFIYTYSRGIYSARIFGYCIIRNKKMFEKLIE